MTSVMIHATRSASVISRAAWTRRNSWRSTSRCAPYLTPNDRCPQHRQPRRTPLNCGPGIGQPLSVRRSRIPKARSGPADQVRRQQELPSVSTAFASPDHSQQVASWRAPIPLPTMATASPFHGPVALGHIGLDLCTPMFAPCLLGCPGTPRYHSVSAARRGCGRPDRLAAPGTCWHCLTAAQGE